jgi:glycosyltransferase involved in cell wall biosynthesis
MKNIYISICVPSYNRPKEIRRLLESIDYNGDKAIEIVVCEDNAPLGDEVEREVLEFKKKCPYELILVRNSVNYGFDKNLRECIRHARGKWIVFMGDDDIFIDNTLNGYIEFLTKHENVGYVLRSYKAIYNDGTEEIYRYYDEDKCFAAGIDTYIELFNKSVFISGFTFKREGVIAVDTDRLDGSLLYQLYLLAEICLKYPSAYYSTPITQSFEGGTPFFGNSEAEKGKYTPETITVQNSIEFMKQYFVVIDYVDRKHNIDAKSKIKRNMSKYSYPAMAIHRDKGRKVFRKYVKMLREIELDESIYFNIYYIGLIIFGKSFCDNIIRFIKKKLGRRPKL